MTNIKNIALGVSSELVAQCNDSSQLAEWAGGLESHLADLSAQTNRLRADYQNGIETDGDQFHKLKTYKKYQAVLKNQVERRRGVIKRSGISAENRFRIDFWRNKVKELDPDNLGNYTEELKSKLELDIEN